MSETPTPTAPDYGAALSQALGGALAALAPGQSQAAPLTAGGLALAGAAALGSGPALEFMRPPAARVQAEAELRALGYSADDMDALRGFAAHFGRPVQEVAKGLTPGTLRRLAGDPDAVLRAAQHGHGSAKATARADLAAFAALRGAAPLSVAGNAYGKAAAGGKHRGGQHPAHRGKQGKKRRR